MDRPDPATQTPDLQAMTGITPPPPLSGPSILSALGSMQGPSPGLAAGSGMLNSLGGGPPGANPYLAQHNVAQRTMLGQVDQARMAQDSQQRQMMMMEQMKQRANEMKMKQHQSELSMAQTLIKLNTPGARITGAKMMAETLKSMGRPSAVGLVEDIGRGNGLTHQEMEDVFKGVERGFSDQALYENYPNLTPKTLGEVRLNIDKDDVRQTLGLRTKDQARKDKLEIQAKENESVIKEWGTLPPEVMARIDNAHIKRTGKSPAMGTPESRAAAYEEGYAGWEAERKAKDDRAEEQLKIQRAREARLDAQAQRQDTLLAQLTGGGGAGGEIPGMDKTISFGPKGRTITYTPMKTTRDNLAGLEQTDQILAQMDEMGKKIITAGTWTEALVQRAKLSGGALTGMIPDAKVYADAKDGMLSVISKTLGKESGVLTDRDIIRISNMIPDFGDTTYTRDLKMGFLNSLAGTTKEVQQAIWDKKPIPNGARAKVLKVITDTEKSLGLPRSVRAVGPDGKSGTMVLRPNESLPPGFKEVTE